MSFVALAVGAGISAIGSAVAANQQKVAATRAFNSSQVNIDALNEKTKQLTSQNAIDTQNLFRQLNPGAYQAQQDSGAGLASSLGGNQYLRQAQDMLGQGLGSSVKSPLLTAAIAKAQSDLAMGGRLDPETQNLVTRTALANSGNVAQGSGSTGLGRDITARDLGLTGLNLQQQRLTNASGLGQQELGQNNADLQALMQRITGLSSLNQNQFGQYLSAAGLTNQIANQSPQVGLSGSSIANLQVGNQNGQAQYYQNIGNANAGLTNGLASAAGQGLGAYAASGGFGSFGSQAGASNPYGFGQSSRSYMNQTFPSSYSTTQPMSPYSGLLNYGQYPGHY